MEETLLHETETFAVRGACFEVYREKGCGFLESVYQECLEIELSIRGISFTAKRSLELEYKGRPLRTKYKPDFLCFDSILVEIKAVVELADEHRAQLLNYLRATGLQVGLLVNFGHYPRIEMERVAASRGRFSRLGTRCTAAHSDGDRGVR